MKEGVKFKIGGIILTATAIGGIALEQVTPLSKEVIPVAGGCQTTIYTVKTVPGRHDAWALPTLPLGNSIIIKLPVSSSKLEDHERGHAVQICRNPTRAIYNHISGNARHEPDAYRRGRIIARDERSQ